MGWTKLQVASGWCVLACACGSVEESVSTSATLGDSHASSSSGVSSAEIGDMDSGPIEGESTQGSASVADTGPDPTDADGTTGVNDASSGADSLGTSTTMPVDPTTDSGETTTDPMPSACDPADGDTACDTCVKTMCCPQVEVCAADMGCWCIAQCVGDGGDGMACSGMCGVEATPPGAAELGGCAALACSGSCFF
jgi:hypothetical protein